MVTNVHRRLSALSLKYAFDEQRSFLSRGFHKIFVQQPPKCISNDNTTSTNTSTSSCSSSNDNNNDDTSSFSSEDDQLSPSVSLTPSTSSYSVPSTFADDCCDDTISAVATTTDAILCMGVVFVWLHIQLQLVILLQQPSTTTITPLPLTTTTTNKQRFDPKPMLPSRSPGPDMPPINDLVKSKVSLETAALWDQHEQLPQRPSTSRRRQRSSNNDIHSASTINDDDDYRLQQAAAVRSLAQDVLAYLEEFSGDVAPELEALRPQLETYVAL